MGAVDAIFDKKGLVLSVPFSKVNDELREVWGIATTDSRDIQGEIVDYEASKKAFQTWTDGFSRVSGGETMGNIREMHKPQAVGKVISWKADDAKKQISVGVRISKSPDGDAAWTKVKEHVLNGFSIGAPTATRTTEYHSGKPVVRVTGYTLAELSLVDNPANQDSWITEIKLAKGAGVMGPLDLMKSDAEPSGSDWVAARKITENAYVDPDGGVWKRVDGVFQNAGGTMSLEKKTIGPVQHTDGKGPGVAVPTVAAGGGNDPVLPKKAREILALAQAGGDPPEPLLEDGVAHETCIAPDGLLQGRPGPNEEPRPRGEGKPGCAPGERPRNREP